MCFVIIHNESNKKLLQKPLGWERTIAWQNMNEMAGTVKMLLLFLALLIATGERYVL